MNKPKSPFGAKLREQRKALGLTQTELAQKAGLSLMTIQRYESGERTPKLFDYQKLDRVLNPNHDALNAQTQAFPHEWSEEQAKEHAALLNQHAAEKGREDTLLTSFRELNEDGQTHVIQFAQLIACVPDLQKTKNSEDDS